LGLSVKYSSKGTVRVSAGCVHALRDPRHPFLRDLELVLGSEVSWGIISG